MPWLSMFGVTYNMWRPVCELIKSEQCEYCCSLGGDTGMDIVNIRQAALLSRWVRELNTRFVFQPLNWSLICHCHVLNVQVCVGDTVQELVSRLCIASTSSLHINSFAFSKKGPKIVPIPSRSRAARLCIYCCQQTCPHLAFIGQVRNPR